MVDIQHIGSTSIKNIKSKPVIDIIVGVTNFENVLYHNPQLEKNSFFFRGYEGVEKQHLMITTVRHFTTILTDTR